MKVSEKTANTLYRIGTVILCIGIGVMLAWRG